MSSNPIAVTLLCICTKYLRRALKLRKMSKYQSLKEARVSYKQKFLQTLQDIISTVLEQSKKMKESFAETENFGICFWKVFNFHVLVFRSSCHFLLSRHPNSLIYSNSRSNHKVYFTRCLLEVLCYLCSIKLVLQRCQFRMYYDLSEEFSFAFKVFNDEPNCWEYYFYGSRRKKK